MKIDPLKLDSDTVTRIISKPYAIKHQIVPIKLSGSLLTVVTSNPFDREGVDGIRQLKGFDVEIMVTSKSDILKLENLWVNLLFLARDAVAVQMPNADIPTIRVISRAGIPAEVIVEIRDNGRPIPAEHLDTIFEPNFIGPTSGRGTGMELSICREIVRQHSGQIKAKSTDGHDTIILVSLPAEV